MQRAVVTGARGFLGRHIVRHLRQRGVLVTTLDCQPAPAASHHAMGLAPWSATRLAMIFATAEPDAIFHLAGGAVGSPAELEQLNLGVAKSVMQALQQIQARPLLVCCGSATEYGAAIIDGVPVCETAVCAPRNAYGMSKLAQTTAALAFAEGTGTPVLVARIFNPIGPGMPTTLALGDFARQLAALRAPHGTLLTGNLRVFRDFLDVEHVAAMLCGLAEDQAARGVVNICSGRATELGELVALLIAASGRKVIVEAAPSRLRPGEISVVVGSTARLASLGAVPPVTDHAAVVGRIWRAAKSCWAGVS